MTKKEKFFKTAKIGMNTTTINYTGYGYGRHCGGMVNVYGYTPEGAIYDYIVTFHRSKKIIEMIKTGKWWTINQDIRANYCTNGYTTRIGIKKADMARCKRLADSHRVIQGGGSEAHDMRVFLRNQ
jgi:hypothetical protein